MSTQWFAIRTKAKREVMVETALSAKGYKCLLPTYRVERGGSKRTRPLFPGYVFGCFDVFQRLPILMTPGVFSIVSRSGVPVPLDASEIRSISILVSKDLVLSPHPYLEVGEKVRLNEGPLKGVEGMVLRSEPQKIIVSISLLQRSLCVVVPREWLEVQRKAQVVEVFST